MNLARIGFVCLPASRLYKILFDFGMGLCFVPKRTWNRGYAENHYVRVEGSSPAQLPKKIWPNFFSPPLRPCYLLCKCLE